MPFTFNAIFYRAASSKNLEPTHLLSGSEAGLPPDPDYDRILAAAAVNVSMLSALPGTCDQGTIGVRSLSPLQVVPTCSRD